MITNINVNENKYNLDFFIEIIKKDLSEYSFETFNLGVSYPYSLSEDEKLLLKKEFQFNLTKKIETELNVKRTDDSIGDVYILIDYNYKRIEYKIKPIYVYGIYKKYSRDLPQTKDFCFKCKGRGCRECNHEGVLKKTSIQEIIESYFKKFIDFKNNKFHGSGREDIDVLMLGNGREFILELEYPKIRKFDENILRNIEKYILEKEKKNLEVIDLRQTEKKEVAEIKNKKNFKLYQAIISCDEKINLEDLNKIKLNDEQNIKQYTPKRISKRRAQITRERSIEFLKVKYLDEFNFKIEIKAEAGLYIKEFISGENNKTDPSVSSIISKPCFCKELTVLWIYR